MSRQVASARGALAFDRLGAGPTLVLLPGLGSRRQAWDPVVALLAPGFDAVSVDLPGFGGSPGFASGTEPTVETFTGSVQAFLERQGIGRPHVAGNSLGGAIALELARRGLVASATALAPIGFWTGLEARYAGLTLRALQTTARIARPLAPRLLAHPSLRALLLAPIVARPSRLDPEAALADARTLADGATMGAIVPHTTRYRFRHGGALRVPVTVAWGDRDRLLPARQARRARRLLPQAHHVALPGAGHVAMTDVPELVARMLTVLRTDEHGPGSLSPHNL